MPFKKKKNETEMTAEQNPEEEEEKAQRLWRRKL